MTTECCDYEDCDQEVEITFKTGEKMCEYHALVSLSCTMEEKNVKHALWDGGSYHVERVIR